MMQVAAARQLEGKESVRDLSPIVKHGRDADVETLETKDPHVVDVLPGIRVVITSPWVLVNHFFSSSSDKGLKG
jgi:hypothetical protein